MRFITLGLALCGLTACAAPTAQQTATAQNPTPAAFNAPMDPGLIQCQNLSNPAALAAATQWAMGQERANVLSGRSSALPDQSVLTNQLVRYCSTNGGDTVRTATSQINGILN